MTEKKRNVKISFIGTYSEILDRLKSMKSFNLYLWKFKKTKSLSDKPLGNTVKYLASKWKFEMYYFSV